jgi:hypothetical protein
MSNIAGKAYAMNVITPISRWRVWINLLIFWAAKTPLMSSRFDGLRTLSLIHYARWVILCPNQFPRLSESQPREKLKYAYMLFFSNFNGSWTQYVDSFHMAIPSGLDLMWKKNIRYPKSVPLQPFHRYITHNQIWTDHYYNAYPLAAANDVKSAMALRGSLLEFADQSEKLSSDADFAKAYNQFLFENQLYLGKMAPSPVVSLANQATRERRRLNQLYGRLDDTL